ncbi:MAG: hypothetical protein AW09_000267 [Candidatus Accumulibacter phosphatis]|uniref:Uncharacterized protein n=1 Tax=Candidatus Accumulibacter phosphatis TaxID=327160 RepID=A0A080LZR9_9PROT|nr:MAG: hypothetical protein AW09_000267 [Candidatus Accumulibacter phosphatis]
MLADAARGGQHVLEIGRTVLVGRRADADELRRPVMHRDGDVGGELHPAISGIALDPLRQTGLMDREAAVVEDLDLALIHIQAEHVVAHFRQAGAGDQANLAGANNGDVPGRKTFLSDRVVVAIAIDQARDARGQRRARREVDPLFEGGGVCASSPPSPQEAAHSPLFLRIWRMS